MKWNRLEKILSVVCVFILVAALLSGFTQSDPSSSVSTLLKQRTQILQNAYFGRQSLEQSELLLERIETHPLLADDIQALRTSMPGQMDWIRSMELLTIEETTSYIDYHSFLVDIRWHMSGLSGNYASDYSYHIVVKEEEGIPFLAEMEAILSEN